MRNPNSHAKLSTITNASVMVNICDVAFTRGNAAISGLAFNQSQAQAMTMMQASNSTRASTTEQQSEPSNSRGTLDGSRMRSGSDASGALTGNAPQTDHASSQRNHELVLTAQMVQGGTQNTCTQHVPTNVFESTLQLQAFNQHPAANNLQQHEHSSSEGTGQSTHSTHHASANAQSGSQPVLPTELLQARQIAPDRRCMPLSAPDDERRLSTQQCWLRQQIETFPASSKDVVTKGRNRLIDVGQVRPPCF